MPIVRISGWKGGGAPSQWPHALSKLLADQAGMDSAEIADAAKQLEHGRYVEAFFDLGEDDSARNFMNDLTSLGLQSQLCDERRPNWYGPRPQAWFIKYAVVGTLWFSALCLASVRFWPGSIFSIFTIVMLLLFGLSVPVVYVIQRNAVMTEAALERERAYTSRVRLVFWIALFLVGGIIAEPWLGVVLLAIAVAGLGCAAIIRVLNERS